MAALRLDTPWLLVLLPLALLPWWRPAGARVAAATLAWLPPDRASRVLDVALRALASFTLAALLLALAGPHRPEAQEERLGTGAEIVILLDRSRSMDQSFAGPRGAGPPPKGTGPEALAYYMRLQGQRSAGASKARVARELLADFAARRADDRIALIGFSTLPLPALGFTPKTEAIQAAVRAGEGARGLAETDIALALQAGLDLFEDQPYTGSRLLMLVSDGGDHIEPEVRERIGERLRRLRVGLTWLYLRNTNAPGLQADDSAGGSAEGLPEVFLHRWFGSLGVPYRAYEADNPEALQRAIADVSRLENSPLVYPETVPRRDHAPLCLALALAGVLALLGAGMLERRQWG